MNGFWQDKSVLVTGHTGFKGGWLALWLSRLEARVHGLSLPPDTSPSLYRQAAISGCMASEALIDLRNREEVQRYVAQVSPEVVIHMAAQPLVRRAYQAPFETFETNVMGSASLLDALLAVGSARVVLCVTTDKCYQNREWIYPYRETDRLGGSDPYSASKAACELLVSSYRASYVDETKLSLATARAGNVIGGGDWAQDRIVPDCIRAFSMGKTVELRNPRAIRPWQHVLDPVAGYLTLAQAQWSDPGHYGVAWNFGPLPGGEWQVQELVEQLAAGWPGGAHWKVAADTARQPAEHQLLRLDISLARELLGWNPVLNPSQALEWTREWYLQWQQQGKAFDAARICYEQIERYMAMREVQ
jgi:CDP-glucose 4,6-dehydratase